MTLPEGLTVVESPKQMLLGTTRAYGIDFSKIGTPADVGDTVAYDKDGADATDMLSGVPTQAGAIITLEEFEPDEIGKFRIVHQVSIGAQTVFGVLDVEVFQTVPLSAGDKTPAAGTYSSLASIGSLVPRYATRTGTFDDTTRPTVVAVVELMEQVSSIVDSMLAENGFDIPVTNTTVKNSLDLFVAQEVAAIVEGINGSGRFGPTTKTGGKRGRFALLFEDVQNFIEANALGFERAGAARSYSIGSEIGYRATDEAGDDIFPIRQRKEFGTVWTNWDK